MKCRACESKQLKNILSLGSQYLSKFSHAKGKAYPLNLVICQNCSLVQLRDTVPAKLLYTDDYGYYSGINQTMRDHLANIVQTVERLAKLSLGDTVIDIGCNDGTLLNSYKTKNIYKLGFDPVKKFRRLVHFAFVPTYFHHLPEVPPAKIITAISMFYDLEKPNKFLKDIVASLAPDGIFIIQQNYLKSMLEQLAFDNIVHEHLEYYSLFSLQNLLRKHNLEVFDVEAIDLNGGSFRTYIKFVDNKSIKVNQRVEQFLKKEITFFVKNPNIYDDFANNVKRVKKNLLGFVKKEVKRGKKVYVYGASTRGNTLLQYCELDKKLITAAVERNEEKWGKKIMSLGIPIISETQAREEKPDYFLVLPWFFKKEFLKREKDFLKQGGSFIFPLPEFSVVHK